MPRLKVRDMGTCLLFGANSTDRVAIGSNIIGTGDITITGWFKASGWGGNNFGRILDGNNFLLYISASGKRIYLQRIASVSAFGSGIELGKWTFFAVTSTSAGITNFRINGVDVTVDSSAGTPVTYGNTFIGTRSGLDRVFDGKIDEIRIFKRILTDTEKDAIYYNDIISSDVTAEYLFDEGSGTTATDSSGNGNDGTITGATYSANVPMSLRTPITTARTPITTARTPITQARTAV